MKKLLLLLVALFILLSFTSCDIYGEVSACPSHDYYWSGYRVVYVDSRPYYFNGYQRIPVPRPHWREIYRRPAPHMNRPMTIPHGNNQGFRPAPSQHGFGNQRR